jgi:DNA adenine methylase
MGSKQSLIPFIFRHLEELKYETVLDAFSGSGPVAYEFKRLGKQVTTNDYLHFSYAICKAVIENTQAKIDNECLSKLLRLRDDAPTFVKDNYEGLFFTGEDCHFIDSLWANLAEIKNEYKKYLAIAAACRAFQKKRPRGIFSFTGRKSWDKRKDLKLSIETQFINAVHLFNDAVFDNGKTNKAHWGDIMDFKETDFDLVYLDPPYWSPLSDNDYVRRYHFVEGFSRYWQGLELDMKTRTRKFKSYPSVFSGQESANRALRDLFQRYSASILVVSYSSNGYPTKYKLRKMLQSVKRKVKVYEIAYRYSFGNHGHMVGKIKDRVREYLFVGT